MAARNQHKQILAAEPDALATTAAGRLLARIGTNSGRIAICRTGGSSPKRLHALLASEPCRRKVPLDRVPWFIGDECFVLSGDPLVRWAVGVANTPVAPRVPRNTLTFSAPSSCRETPFEVAGLDKRAILTCVLAGENMPANPAQSIGEMVLLADREALPEIVGGQ